MACDGHLDLALIDFKRLEFLRFLIVIKLQAGIAAALQPLGGDVTTAVHFNLQFRILRADLIDGMTGGHIVLLPSLAHGLLLVVQLADVLDGTLQDGPLVLVTIGDETRDLINALVDGLATSAFHCKTVKLADSQASKWLDGITVPSLWLFLRIWCHSGEPTDGF